MTPTLATDDLRWDAFVRRDPACDGLFLVAVRTTKIFCRPTCPARRPRRENVTFHAAPPAGHRPCKRCRPLEEGPPAWMRELMAAPGPLSDDDLVARGLEPRTVRRHFLRAFGVTFHAWQRARRVGDALDALASGEDLTRAGLDAGYESLSGFRDAFARVVGDAPGRARGAGAMRVDLLTSPLGPIVAAAVDEGVCLVEFALPARLKRQAERLARRLGRPLVPGDHVHLRALGRELREYFAGERRAFEVPVVAPGSAFDEAVWSKLRAVPYGETRTYDALARELGRPGAARAVGGAVGRNRLGVLIPCHRIVRGDGTLSGYGGGLWRKERLLALERATGARAASS